MIKKFTLYYIGYLIILFTLLYAPTSVLSLAINEFQTNLTLQLIKPFLSPDQLKGIDIWISPHYKIYISQACNGMIPIYFLWAAIFAYPAKIRHKVIWIVIGYICFSIINILRIVWVVYIAEKSGSGRDFYWSHDLIGNMILILTGLGLFIAFIKTKQSAT